MSFRTLTLLVSFVLLSQSGCGSDSAAPGAEWVRLRDPQAPEEPLVPARDAARFGYRHDYRFTEDWFTKRVPYWVSLLRESMGQPGLRYLEVGVFEGRSLMWMVDNVLTDETSHATGIDIMLADALLENVERSGAAGRITLLRAFSQVQLRKLELSSYDIIYIDGSHMANDVLEDIVLAWRLLKPGGLLILDDYHYTASGNTRGVKTPAELRPKVAIDGFVSAFRNTVIVEHKGYQMALRKATHVCIRRMWQCSRFGDYSYDWREGVLYRGDEDFELSGPERKLLEHLIRSKVGDGLTLRVKAAVLEWPLYQTLNERLELRLTPLPAEPGA